MCILILHTGIGTQLLVLVLTEGIPPVPPNDIDLLLIPGTLPDADSVAVALYKNLIII